MRNYSTVSYLHYFPPFNTYIYIFFFNEFHLKTCLSVVCDSASPSPLPPESERASERERETLTFDGPQVSSTESSRQKQKQQQQQQQQPNPLSTRDNLFHFPARHSVASHRRGEGTNSLPTRFHQLKTEIKRKKEYKKKEKKLGLQCEPTERVECLAATISSIYIICWKTLGNLFVFPCPVTPSNWRARRDKKEK